MNKIMFEKKVKANKEEAIYWVVFIVLMTTTLCTLSACGLMTERW